jgi:hypothetical protein
LATEFRQIKVAPAPRDDAKRQARQLVAALARQGRPTTITTQFGELKVSGWMGDGLNAPTPHSVTVQFLCWLDPERVIAALEREIAAMPVDVHALPLDQRAERLAELEAEVLRLECEEEQTIMAAAEQGIIIVTMRVRRASCRCG